MAKPYTFYIRGTDTFFSATDNGVSVSVVDSAPDLIEDPTLETGLWRTLSCMGANAELVNEGETWLTPAGSEYQDNDPRWKLTIRTTRFRFPDDFNAYKNLMTEICSPYVFIRHKNYPIFIPNTAGFVMPCTIKVSAEHTYDDGSKRLTLEVRKRNITTAL